MPELDTQPPLGFMQWEDVESLVGSIRSRSLVARPTTLEQCREALAYFRRNDMTICARGAGRGYGDLALNDGNALLDMSRMNKIRKASGVAISCTGIRLRRGLMR